MDLTELMCWLGTLLVACVALWTGSRWLRYRSYSSQMAHMPALHQFVPHYSMLISLAPLPKAVKKWLFPRQRNQSRVSLPAEFARLKTPILACISYNIPQVMVNDPQLMKEICVTKRKAFIKPTEVYGVLELFGENIVTAPDGDAWKRHRAIANPAFNEANCQLVAQATLRQAEQMFAKWATKDEVNASDDMTRLALAVIGEAGFGQSFDVFADEASAEEALQKASKRGGFRLSFRQVMEVVSANTLWKLILPAFLFRYPPNQRLKTVGIAFDEFVGYAQRIIEERRCKAKEERQTRKDVLSQLISALECEEGSKSLTDSHLVANTFIFLFAGHETTANTLTFAMHELATNPEAQRKMHEEAVAVLGGCAQEEIYGRLDQLVYCRAVFEETLRMYPPVVSVPKKAIEDTELAGYAIPAGTHISLEIYGMHHNPLIWPRPEEFLPERFLPENSDNAALRTCDKQQFAFGPFSLGRRSCIGKKFAMIEGTLALALIAQRYTVEAVETTEPFDVHSVLTLQPVKPVMVRMVPRKDA